MSNHVSVEDVPLNRFHRLLTVRSGGGSFVDGYVLSIIGIAMTKVSPALGLNTFWEGLIAASALIGIFFGGFIGGALTDRLGRRILYFFWSDAVYSLLAGAILGTERRDALCAALS